MNTSSSHYDGIIIGSGQGGNPLAKALASAGWRVALIERKYVGGSCLNYGCTPTKTMVASAREAYMAGRAQEYGVLATSDGVDMERVRQRKRDIVERSRASSQDGLEEVKGLDLIFGTARFTGPKTMVVKKNDGDTLSLTGGKVFIDTGTRAAMPKIDGFENIADLPNVLDNVSIMELDHVPEHLLILGGGYIGLEFAQMFRRFGSRVTIVQSGPQLLMREDADMAEEVTKILREDGIEVVLNAEVKQVGGDAGEITLEREGARLKGTHLLVAVGRVPNTDDLDLAAAGMAADDHGYVRVNDRLETNVEGVYGIGDVKGGPAFTHISYDDYRILRANLLEGGNTSIEGRIVPYTVFIDPQLGRIGATEREARARGKNIRVAKMPMTSVARAREFGETRGVMKVIVDAGTKQILGAAVLGMEGGELAGMVQLAMMGGLPYTALQEGIFSHPTLAESLNVIFGHFED
jgi:pyruvate/2-oxoglutarate dehydrogenase complex dihydrolipoamide dehydrogenase (E3) component